MPNKQLSASQGLIWALLRIQFTVTLSAIYQIDVFGDTAFTFYKLNKVKPFQF